MFTCKYSKSKDYFLLFIPRADVIAHQELIVAREIVTQLESRLNFPYFSAGFL